MFNKPTAMRAAAAADHESLPVGQLSALQEDENGYYATAVIEKAEDRLKLATVMWSKEPVQSWRARVEEQLPNKIELDAAYTLPAIADGTTTGCTPDTWATTALNIPT